MITRKLRAYVRAPSRRVMRNAAAALATFTFSIFALSTGPANAMKIQTVKSPGGIEAWLVEEHSVPLMALRFSFEGGNAQDPMGKDGVANFLTAMMDEGAGDMNAAAYQEKMEELSFRMSYDDTRDAFYGSFETLTANRDQTIPMLQLALTRPRFDTDAVDRIRRQLQANLVYSARDPEKTAYKEWFATAFSGHAYGRPSNGTEASLAAITRDDLENYRSGVFARSNLKVVAVGDIDPVQLGKLLDDVFGSLPAQAKLEPVAVTDPVKGGREQLVEMKVPQAVAVFGLGAMPRKDPDFLTAFVINQILGGGGFASTLMEEVREKRGLAYSVYTFIQPLRHGSVFTGGVATKAEAIETSLDVIRGELKRMADNGPTPEQFDNAKKYLVGSYPLRFDTNAKIATQLLGLYEEGFGPEYVEQRNALIEAITIEDAKRVAKRLLANPDLIVTVVGPKPDPAKKVAAPPPVEGKVAPEAPARMAPGDAAPL
jgi:zinc protease